MLCTSAAVAVAVVADKVGAMTEEKANGDDSQDERETTSRRPVVARSRLLVAMAAAPKPPAEVFQWGSVIDVARRVIGRATARRRYAADAKDGGHSADAYPTFMHRWGRNNGRGHDAGVCPSWKEEAVLAVASDVGARDDNQEKGIIQASTFKAEETGKNGDGSKRSGRQWAGLLVETVVEHGMEQCMSDPCGFSVIADGKVELMMAVHVENIAIAETCRNFPAAPVSKFPQKILGELIWNISCAFKRGREMRALEIMQNLFIESMQDRFGANSSSDIPATPGVELGTREEGDIGGDWPYREAVGSLMRLSIMTRSDISNAVRALATHSHNPTDRHWKAVLKDIYSLPPWDQVYGVDVRAGLGIIKLRVVMLTMLVSRTIGARYRGR